MENPGLLYEHWQIERKLFEKNLDTLRKRITVHAVHDLRVCIKKLKAYRNLFYLLNKSKSKVKFKETANLFNVIGRLRNVHICLDLVAQYEKEDNFDYKGLTGFLKMRTRQIKLWCKQTIKHYQGKELGKFESVLAAAQTDRETELIEVEINLALDDLEALVYDLHQLRQFLKKIYYWIKTLSEKQANEVYKTESINDVTMQLGIWQDSEILLHELKYFKNEVLPKTFEEKKHLKKLEEKVKTKKQSAKNEALNKLNFR